MNPTTMDFGAAIRAMKQGKRVARTGWNGKGMYLWLLPAAHVKAEWCKEPHLKELAEQNGGEVECLGSVRMKTADGKVLTGWLASQTDMLAEDWVIVEAEDTPTPENRAEAIGKALGTALAPLALLNARPGDKPPEVHVNIWTIH